MFNEIIEEKNLILSLRLMNMV